MAHSICVNGLLISSSIQYYESIYLKDQVRIVINDLIKHIFGISSGVLLIIPLATPIIDKTVRHSFI